MAAVFGADVPAEAGPNFVPELVDILHSHIPPLAINTQVLLEQPWMSFRARHELSKYGVGCIPFEDQWPTLSRNVQTVAAMNSTDIIVIMLPQTTLDDFENGHRHSIIEQAVIAMGLHRSVLCNNYTALGTFISRRLEESPQ
jgi:hypothetical protein